MRKLMCLVMAAALLGRAAWAGGNVENKATARGYGSAPTAFVENLGQWADTNVRYALSGGGVSVGLTRDGLRFQLHRREGESRIPRAAIAANAGHPSRMMEFHVAFEGARVVAPVGCERAEQVANYHHGAPDQWREGVPTWQSVVYPGLYDGIDLVVKAGRGGIKYEFRVASGADWRAIRIHYEGIEDLALGADGALAIRPALGWPALADAAPVAWQDPIASAVPSSAPVRTPVLARFRLIDPHTLAFNLAGPVDPARPLVIDPTLAWSTYAGGINEDVALGVAVDSAGNAYMVGWTYSAGWVSGGPDTSFGGGDRDAFVVKVSPGGGHRWSTYLGGSDDDVAVAVAIDSDDNVYVTGETTTAGWVSGGFDTTLEGSHYDAYVVKLSPAGGHIWSTYLGGSEGDGASAIAVTEAGDIGVTGSTTSPGWVAGGYDTIFDNDGFTNDGFVAKLSTGGALLWSTYLGGSKNEFVEAIASDTQGNFVVGGETESPGWVSGGYDKTFGGGIEGFVVKLSADGGHLWSTYLGESGYTSADGIATDDVEAVYVTGPTTSADWAVSGYDPVCEGVGDAFAVKFAPGGALVWATYIGGRFSDSGAAIVVDGTQGLYVTGATNSDGWIAGGPDVTFNGYNDAFVVKLTLDGAPRWSTYLGGSGNDSGSALAVDGAGHVWVDGYTASPNWTWRGYDILYNDGGDAFLAKITDIDGLLSVMIDPPEAAAAGAQWRRVGTTPWLDSGATEDHIPVGDYEVEFKALANWDAPTTRPVTIAWDQTTTATGTYVLHLGNLQVTLAPPEAAAAGARWRRVGLGTPWMESGAAETGIRVGYLIITFNDVPGWDTPLNQPVLIAKDETTTAAAVYVRQTGALQVTLTPPEAATAGARWRRAGTEAWLESSAVDTTVPTGDYEIEYLDLAGWIAPATQMVTIAKDQTATAAGSYIRPTGSLTVTIAPPEAVAAGARWRRVGTEDWLESGATEAGILTGDCQVEFLALPGWDSPVSRLVTILYNRTIHLDAHYADSDVNAVPTDLWTLY